MIKFIVTCSQMVCTQVAVTIHDESGDAMRTDILDQKVMEYITLAATEADHQALKDSNGADAVRLICFAHSLASAASKAEKACAGEVEALDGAGEPIKKGGVN